MIGTPDLSSVYIWRLNSCTSIDVTFFSVSARPQAVWSPPLAARLVGHA